MSAPSRPRHRAPPREGDSTDAVTEPRTAVKLAAEAIGTFVLVLGGCGAAVLATAWPTSDGIQVGIGYLGVSLWPSVWPVFARAVSATAGVSGGHLNPAVTVGLAVSGRSHRGQGRAAVRGSPRSSVLFPQPWRSCSTRSPPVGPRLPRPGEDRLVSNGFGTRSPGGSSSLASVFVAQLVLTAVFVARHPRPIRDPGGRTDDAGSAGDRASTLTAIHLVAIPIFEHLGEPRPVPRPGPLRGWRRRCGQLWLFVLAPLVGAALAGALHVGLFRTPGHRD